MIDANTFLLGDDPSIGPSLTPTQKALLDFAAGLPPLRPEPERDHQGRYKLPDPTTGKVGTFTRTTNLAGELDDTFNLQRWQQRLVALGLATNPGLVNRVLGIEDPSTRDGKRDLNAICERAMWLAGGDLSAALGTAMHTVTEHWDDDEAGFPSAAMPDAVDADLHAYHFATDSLEWVDIECIVVNPAVKAAGTVDRIARCPDGALRICDLKTAADMSYSWVKTAIQLAVYANATHIWRGDHYDEMYPDIDKAIGYVFHLPIGQGACTVYEVDLVEGWRLAQEAAQVRSTTSAARSMKGKLAKPVDLVAKPEVVEQLEATLASYGLIDEDAPPATAVLTDIDRNAWLRDRLARVTDPQAQRYVAANWPAGASPSGPWTNEQIDTISALILPVEDSWPDPDPNPPIPDEPEPAVEDEYPHPRSWEPADDGTPADEAIEAIVAAGWTNLPAARQELGRVWMRDARSSGHPFDVPKAARTARHVAISAAVVECLHHLWDDEQPNLLARLVLAHLLGFAIPDAWHTGSVLGALDSDQAQALYKIARGFGLGEPDPLALVGGLVSEHTNQGATEQ